MEMEIEIIDEEAENIPRDYFNFLLHDKFLYNLEGTFVAKYEPSQNGERRGTVSIKGIFDPLGVYTVISRQYNLSLIKLSKETESEIPSSDFFAPYSLDLDTLESVLGGETQ